MPILTLSAANIRGKDTLALSHAAVKKAKLLATYSWQDAIGKWLVVTCQVTYSDEGQLQFYLKDLVTGETLIAFTSDKIDMWRGTKDSHFVRPKWGIYRSLKSEHMLRDQEEQVGFADFVVTKH